MNARTIAAVLAVLSFLVTPSSPGAQSESPLDPGAVYALLDAVDAIMAAHPGVEAEMARIDSLEGEARAAALAEKRRMNERDDAVTAAVDALLSAPAYRLYFMRFRFTKPETHRNILLSLPFEAARGPADVSHNLMELCRHRAAVRAWADATLARLDAAACVERAREWLPPGDYLPPPVRFIYDGNGDAFATFGGIVFDVFSVVFRFRPQATRFDDLDGAGVEEMERVIAHEYHHVFAGPLAAMPEPANGAERREQQVARRMVSEGTALLCDLGPGLRRDAMEDESTVRWWIDSLNERLSASAADTLGDDDWEAWLGTTYSSLAMERLRDVLARSHPGEDVGALARANAASRPMLVYTLGWHMIGRILEQPDGKDRVLALLRSPHRVFAEYNRTLGEDELHLRIATSYQ